MPSTVPNPWPLNIGTKQDSWDKLQLLQYLDPSLKLSAAELNSIVQALNWLHNQTGGGGDLDGIIQIGTLAIVSDPNVPGGLALNIPNLPLPTWRINSIIYSKPTNTFVSIPSAASDKYRIDYVVANTSNNFQRVAGEERSDIGVPPQLPADTVLVCEIHIFGAEIGTPIPTTAGFITRSSQQYRSFLLLDVPPKVFQLSSEYTSFIIKNSAGSGLVAGFTTTGIGSVGNPPHDGMDIYIKNVGSVAFTLQHNNTTDAAVPFFFADGLALVVPAGVILHFKYNVAGRVELVRSGIADAADSRLYFRTNGAYVEAISKTTADTGTSIDMGYPLGNACNMLAANTNSAFTLTNIKPGGESIVLINRATKPTITGASEIPGHTFQVSTNMHLKVKCRQSGIVQYYFLKLS